MKGFLKNNVQPLPATTIPLAQPQKAFQNHKQSPPNPPMKKDQVPGQFQIKKFKKFIFRNFQCLTEPGIIIFLSKNQGQESLECLIQEIFKKAYPSVRLANFIYFDIDKNIIHFNAIKQNQITYFYITEADLDMQLVSKDEQDGLLSYPQSNIGSTNQLHFYALDDEIKNIDLFVIRESSYKDYISERFDLIHLTQSYAEIQFFLEQCYEEVWNYLSDFAQVSHVRRKRLANIVDTLEEKRNEIHQVSSIVESIHEQFQQQQEIVQQLLESLGFDENIIEQPTIEDFSKSRFETNREQMFTSQQNPLSYRFQQQSVQSLNSLQTLKANNLYKSYAPTDRSSISKSQQRQNDSIDDFENDFLPKSAKEV